MPTIGVTYPTILDVMKLLESPAGLALKLVETLAQKNAILQDAPYIEGNQTAGHKFAAEASLPSLTWRRINEGIAASKGTDTQVVETCGMLEGRSVVDAELVRLNGGANYRLKSDKKFTTAMNNEIGTSLFYHSTQATPEKILGLSPRFDTFSGISNSANVVPSGLTAANADQNSVWFITWGPDTAYLIYPKGTMGGITTKDMGLEYETDANDATKKFLAWRTHFIWRTGLCIEDWRYVVRICNIDSSVMNARVGGTDMGVELIHAFAKAYNRIRDFSSGRTVIYCNRTVRQWIDQQIIDKSNIHFGSMEWGGNPVASYRGLPILVCDALTSTEALVA